MKAYWLNKQNNKKLIVFFAGWSFDYHPFATLDTNGYDVIFVYDYNNIEVPYELNNLQNYKEKFLVAWSMGVFVANKLKDLFGDYDYKLAINGTPTPVDDNYGIPVKIFELTLKHVAKGLEGKFYRNIFLTQEEYNLYSSYPVRRTIENRISELENLYSICKDDERSFYDFAIISEHDKIIPPANQIASYKRDMTEFVILPYGHFLFYNFSSWDEILRCKQIIKQ